MYNMQSLNVVKHMVSNCTDLRQPQQIIASFEKKGIFQFSILKYLYILNKVDDTALNWAQFIFRGNVKGDLTLSFSLMFKEFPLKVFSILYCIFCVMKVFWGLGMCL